MILKTAINPKLDAVASLAKPIVRPWYGPLVLNPLIKIFLQTITLEKAYGSAFKKYYLFPEETIATPEVAAMPPFDSPFKYLEGDSYTTHDIFSTVLEGVLFEPGNGVVLTQSRQIIAESLYPYIDNLTIAAALLNKNFIKRKFFEEPVETISGYSSVYQGLPNGYYHKLVDLIPRCFLLNQPEYSELEKIKLLYADPLSESEKLLMPRLVPSNVKMNRLVPGRLYYLEKLILPTFLTKYGSGYLPRLYLDKLLSEFCPKRPSKRTHRIFISRKKSANKLKKRHIANEEALFEALNKFGFERYELENYSLEAKIELFYDAEIVIGTHGAGLSHIMFSDKVNFLELQVVRNIQTYFYYLAKSKGHNYRYWCAGKSNTRENFAVDIPAILELLKGWI